MMQILSWLEISKFFFLPKCWIPNRSPTKHLGLCKSMFDICSLNTRNPPSLWEVAPTLRRRLIPDLFSQTSPYDLELSMRANLQLFDSRNRRHNWECWQEMNLLLGSWREAVWWGFETHWKHVCTVSRFTFAVAPGAGSSGLGINSVKLR